MGNAVGRLGDEDEGQAAAVLRDVGVQPHSQPAKALIVNSQLFPWDVKDDPDTHAGSVDLASWLPSDNSDPSLDAAARQGAEAQAILVELWGRRMAVHGAVQVAEEMYAGIESALMVQYAEACAALGRPAVPWWKRKRLPPRLPSDAQGQANAVLHTAASAALAHWMRSAFADGQGPGQSTIAGGAAAVGAWAEFIARNPLAAASFAAASARFEESVARAAAAGALGRQVASQNGGGESGTERVDSGEAGSIHGSAAAAVAVAATRAGRIDFRNGRWYVFNPEHADSTGPVLGTAEGAAGLFEVPNWTALEEDHFIASRAARSAASGAASDAQEATSSSAYAPGAGGASAGHVRRLRVRVQDYFVPLRKSHAPVAWASGMYPSEAERTVQLEAQLATAEDDRTAAEANVERLEEELARAERALGSAAATVSRVVSEARGAWGSALSRCAALRSRMAEGRDTLERLRWEAAEVAEEVLDEDEDHREAVSADLRRIAEEVAENPAALRPMLAEAFLELAEADERAVRATADKDAAQEAVDEAQAAAEAARAEARVAAGEVAALSAEAEKLRQQLQATVGANADLRAEARISAAEYERERTSSRKAQETLLREATDARAQLAAIRRSLAAIGVSAPLEAHRATAPPTASLANGGSGQAQEPQGRGGAGPGSHPGSAAASVAGSSVLDVLGEESAAAQASRRAAGPSAAASAAASATASAAANAAAASAWADNSDAMSDAQFSDASDAMSTMSTVQGLSAAQQAARREVKVATAQRGARNLMKFEAIKQERNALRAQVRTLQQDLDGFKAEMARTAAVRAQLQSLQEALFI